MEPLYLQECRMCMCYRHLKPLDAEMVRKIGSCFGIMINLEDKTLPLGVCRKCTKKVVEVKKYRDFYVSVQTKLFVKRSNYFLRIDRQPLVEVILKRNESPKFIFPTEQPTRDKKRVQSSPISISSSETSPKSKTSGNLQTSMKSTSTSSTIATDHGHTDANTVVHSRECTDADVALPNQRATAVSVSPRKSPPVPSVPSASPSSVTIPEDEEIAHSNEANIKTEANEQDNIPEERTFAIEKIEMEVLETDTQSQDETETIDDMATDLQEQNNDTTEELEEDIQEQNYQSKNDEVEDMEEEYLYPNELNDEDSLDSELVPKQEQFDPNEIEVLDDAELTEDHDGITENENVSRECERRRTRGKISGRELYKSLLTECNICSKMIERNRLEGHINRHYGRRPYECPIQDCLSRFHCKHACRLHVRCRHGSESFTCANCGKVYKARRDLLGHIRETHAEPRFTCDVCGKKFTTRSRLKQHRFYHTGERNYPCRACEMRFFSNFQLKVHMRTHTKSFPYKCSVCNKRFRYRHMAKEHIVKDHGIDISLQKDWVIQYPEPDPEEVEVINAENNIIKYSVQRLEEEDEEDEENGARETEDSCIVSLKIENPDIGTSPAHRADNGHAAYMNNDHNIMTI